MAKLLISDLEENMNFESSFLVAQKSLLTSKTNRPYLSLKLADSSGEIEARVWDNAEEIATLFDKKDFIHAVGRAVVYQDKMQVSLVKIKKLNPNEINISDFLPMTKKNIEEMASQLLQLIRTEIKNDWIRKLLLSIFEDAEILSRFKRAPAAKTNHHAWVGGLLEHVLHLCDLARDVLKHYPMVNPDLVYTGLMLHDIGKIYEMSYETSFDYTDDGQLVGHLIQGVEMIYDKVRAIPNFPPKIKTHVVHLVLAHHGKLEFGSPKLPMTLEALMVHYLDDLDSKIQGVLDLAAKENSDSRWTSFNRLFGRPMYKNSQGDLDEMIPTKIEANHPPQNSSSTASQKRLFKEPLSATLAEQLQQISKK